MFARTITSAVLWGSTTLFGGSGRVQDPQCEDRTIEGRSFVICSVAQTAVASLDIAPAPHPERRNWTIARLDSTLRAQGRTLLFATNAGLFYGSGRAMGLLMRAGSEITPLNTMPGPVDPRTGDACNASNFYCPPNGVFYVVGREARIASTADFRRRNVAVASIRVATQSGPMLLSGGKFARTFRADWTKRIPRNAVCLSGDGNVKFVLGHGQTHASFARALRNTLNCRDALFLDGAISALYTGSGPVPSTWDYGAIIFIASAR